MTGDWHLAADVVQEALTRMYVAWPRLERSGGLPTYARRAVMSAVVDHRRRRWNQERPGEVPDAAGAGEPGPEDRDLMLRALRAVPARQRACLVLRFYDELSVAETAEALGCSQGTVKSQTARGLDALRDELERVGHTDLVDAVKGGSDD
jgi:RNA polymerase sigma-70 factor (sigma-E family)